MATQSVMDQLIKTYSDRTYRYTTMVRHKGVVVAFAMDDTRRIFYAVFNLDQCPDGALDVSAWPEDPKELEFPTEIERVGYGIAGTTPMPAVKAGTRLEADPDALSAEERDPFLSSTARLTEAAPFQALSDGMHLYLFRQSLSTSHADMVFILANGGTAGTQVGRPDSDFLMSQGSKVPIVKDALLCDRYVLSGDSLKPKCEVRFRRSRNRTEPASAKDTMGATDMEGTPFYEPTHQLDFVTNLTKGRFGVVLLPTQVAGLKRWQIFAHNGATSRVDAYNLECADDGLFNVRGTQLYTSPDSKYSYSVLEREPGTCPFTGKDLIPVAQGSGHAATCVDFDGVDDYVSMLGGPSDCTGGFCFEAWVYLRSTNLTSLCNLSNGAGKDIIGLSYNPSNRSLIALSWPSSGASTLESAADSIMPKTWTHVAMSMDAQGGTALFVNGKQVRAGRLPPAAAVARAQCYLGAVPSFGAWLDGRMDEVRFWNRPRTETELASDMHRRLVGDEPGLTRYYNFDEGSGSALYDQVIKGLNAVLVGGPQWVASDAPIGETPALKRDSFSLSGPIFVGDTVFNFTGSNYLEAKTGLLNNLAAFTLEGWVYRSENNGRYSLFGQNDQLEFGINSSGQLEVWSVAGISVTNAVVFPLKEWHHVAIVGSASALSIYQDGQLVATGGGAPSNYGSSADKFRVGAGVWSGGGSDPFKGRMNEIRVWKRALSAYELNNVRTRYLTGKEADLLACYRLENIAPDAGTVNDLSAAAQHLTILGGASSAAVDSPASAKCVRSGFAAQLYYQQEQAPSGLDGDPLPMKQQARVMLALGVGADDDGTSEANLTYMAALDFAVSREGRLSLTPDVVRLPGLSLGNGQDLDRLGVLEQRLQELFARMQSAEGLFRNKLQAVDKKAFSLSGSAVSVSTDYVLVGSPFDSSGGSFAGAAYVFEKDGSGGFAQKKQLLASGLAAFDYFGTSVAIDGSYAVVGAPNTDGSETDCGAAYVFERDGNGNWVQRQKLQPSVIAAGTCFGQAVAVSGTAVIIGAPGRLDPPQGGGAAYLFERGADGVWAEKQRLAGSLFAAGYGRAVSISGSTACAGAANEVELFQRDAAGAWSATQQIYSPATTPAVSAPWFGSAVSLKGNLLAVGTPGYSAGTGVPAKAAAFVYGRDANNQWTLKQQLASPELVDTELFGTAVAVSDDTVVVGAPSAQNGVGAAYVFKKLNGQWVTRVALRAGDGAAQDHFGQSVALSGTTMVAGAPNESSTVAKGGAAYVFSPDPALATQAAAAWAETQQLKATATGAISSTMASIFTDPSGLVLGGGLLHFAATDGERPYILDSATGTLNLYFRGKNRQFFVAYYDTMVSRTRFELPVGSGTLRLTARSAAAELNNVFISVGAGSSDDTCTLTIRHPRPALVETWKDLPRDPKQFADILNGTVSCPATVKVTVGDPIYAPRDPVAPGAGDPIYAAREGSLLFTAATDQTDGKIVNGAASIVGQGSACRWTSDSPGRAYRFDGLDDAIIQPASAKPKGLELNGANSYVEVNSPLPLTNGVTIEFWAKGGSTLPQPTVVFAATDAGSNRVILIHFPWSDQVIYFDVGSSGANYDRANKTATPAEYKDTWTHWAFMKDVPAGKITIYKNGQLWNETTGMTRGLSGITRYVIGAHYGGAQYFYPGALAEFRIWNTARTAAQIQSYMNVRLQGNEAGLMAYYSPDKWQPGQQLSDLSGNGRHGTVRGTPQLVDGPSALPMIGSGVLAGTVTDSDLSLEAWVLPLNVQSRSRLVHHLSDTCQYTLGLEPTLPQSALELQANSSAFVKLPELNFDYSKGFTFEAWVLFDDFSNWSRIFDWGNGQASDNIFLAHNALTGKLSFSVFQGTSGTYLETDGEVLALGKWAHLAVSVTAGGTATLYKDGAVVKTGQVPMPRNLKRTQNYLGRSNWPTDSYFIGRMDEIRFWNRPRTADQIKTSMPGRLVGNEDGLLLYYHFEDVQAKDYSNHGLDGIVYRGSQQVSQVQDSRYQVFAGVNNQTVMSFGTFAAKQWTHIACTYKQAYALQFDVGSYLDCGKSDALNLTKDLTIEVFLQVPQLGTQYGLLSQGRIWDGTNQSVPYQLGIEADGRLCFWFQSSDGMPQVYFSSASIQAGVFHRIAVTRKRCTTQVQSKHSETLVIDGQSKTVDVVDSVVSQEWDEIRFYIDFMESGRYDCKGKGPGGHPGPLEIGRTFSNRQVKQFCGVISEVRIWDKCLQPQEVGIQLRPDKNRPIALYQFEENRGNIAYDSAGDNHAKIRGAKWVRDLDPRGSKFLIYANGIPVQSFSVSPISSGWGTQQITLGGIQTQSGTTDLFNGVLEEVRIWKTVRTQEQITDNLFTRLKGEKQDLIAYYSFDDDSTQVGAQLLMDNGLGQRHLPLPLANSRPTVVLSTAPISNDAALVRSALAAIRTPFQECIDASPSAQEYGDLERDAENNFSGVMKRCYAWVQDGKWLLLAGYKVGNLKSEWVGQAQFAPQIIGYIEGAPPMPSENMHAGNRDHVHEDYDGKASVSVIEADSVNYTYSASKEHGFASTFELAASAGFEFGDTTGVVVAPMGFGSVLSPKVKMDLNSSTSFEASGSWSEEHNVGTGRTVTRTFSAQMEGSWEPIGSLYNPTLGQRYLAANTGFAMVQSETVDIFALRLEHNNMLVSFRFQPNPDIPPDWNIIPFPINPSYVKQGTLDGKIGFKADGSICWDTDYPQARDHEEYSYYKPREAYAIKKRIEREEQSLRNYYDTYDAAAVSDPFGGLMRNASGLGMALLGAVPGTAAYTTFAGLKEALNAKDSELPRKLAKRNIVNTYVWTAAGGFFAENTETTDVQQDSVTGNYSFTSTGSSSLSFEFDLGATVGLELNGSLSGSMNLTKSKSKDAEKNFSLEVSIEPSDDLQQFKIDDAIESKWVGVYDTYGKPVLQPGRVDAYRFMTIYLEPDSQNFEDLFGKIVNPFWLGASNEANAVALRQAQQSKKKPACWRVLHRVTFVSRLLPSSYTSSPPPLEKAMADINITSNWQLIQKIEPFVRNSTLDPKQFRDAVTLAVKRQVPQLIPHTEQIIVFMAQYCGVDL